MIVLFCIYQILGDFGDILKLPRINKQLLFSCRTLKEYFLLEGTTHCYFVCEMRCAFVNSADLFRSSTADRTL